MTDIHEDRPIPPNTRVSRKAKIKAKYADHIQSLDSLGDEIMANHRRAGEGNKDALKARRRAGALLRKLKGNLPHGDFDVWCKKYIDISHTTRASYMKVDEGWSIYEATLGTVPENDRQEVHYSLAYVLKAVTGDILWTMIEEQEIIDFRCDLTPKESKSFVDAIKAWNDEGDLGAIEVMLDISRKRGWRVRDLAKSYGEEIEDAADFAVEAQRALCGIDVGASPKQD